MRIELLHPVTHGEGREVKTYLRGVHDLPESLAKYFLTHGDWSQGFVCPTVYSPEEEKKGEGKSGERKHGHILSMRPGKCSICEVPLEFVAPIARLPKVKSEAPAGKVEVQEEKRAPQIKTEAPAGQVEAAEEKGKKK